ncbi:hypothetical protein CONCODRAFT_45005, partial [Conidiobolus coronatus NRRL 28638]
DHNLSINLEKYYFRHSSLSYLGFVISEKGLYIKDIKIKKIKNWLYLKIRKDI